MPASIVKINNSDELSWYVGDSIIDNLIIYLDKIGFRENKEEIEHEDEAISS